MQTHALTLQRMPLICLFVGGLTAPTQNGFLFHGCINALCREERCCLGCVCRVLLDFHTQKKPHLLKYQGNPFFYCVFYIYSACCCHFNFRLVKHVFFLVLGTFFETFPCCSDHLKRICSGNEHKLFRSKTLMEN